MEQVAFFADPKQIAQIDRFCLERGFASRSAGLRAMVAFAYRAATEMPLADNPFRDPTLPALTQPSAA
jgi:hypothetical protein